MACRVMSRFIRADLLRSDLAVDVISLYTSAWETVESLAPAGIFVCRCCRFAARWY